MYLYHNRYKEGHTNCHLCNKEITIEETTFLNKKALCSKCFKQETEKVCYKEN